MPSRAPAWWIASRPRRPVWAGSNGATTAPRRSKDVSDTSWWTLRAWCSKRGFTAQKSKTATASSSCSNRRTIASHGASLTCGWTPLYTGQDKGADWVESVLGWSTEIVRHPPKPAPEEVMMRWAKEWAKEGAKLDSKKLLPPEGPRPFLPRRWVVERTFSWLSQNRRLSKDYERLAETSEALVYVAMTRLMARRLARAQDFSQRIAMMVRRVSLMHERIFAGPQREDRRVGEKGRPQDRDCPTLRGPSRDGQTLL